MSEKEATNDGKKRSHESDASIAKESIDSRGKDDGSMDDPQQRLEAKRAYNRMNAARARKRTKDRISVLGDQVEEQAIVNAKLMKINKELNSCVDRLVEENRDLRHLAMQSGVTPSKITVPDRTSLYSAEAATNQQFQHHQLLSAGFGGMSGLLPIIQHQQWPGGHFQLFNQADQQRLLQAQQAGFQQQQQQQLSPSMVASSLQDFVQQQKDQQQQHGAPHKSEHPYFDLVQSVLAEKRTEDKPSVAQPTAEA
ncbi:hypothetical protein MPSEU_000632600 [Mayamaea pseudoterrestris]|nr:hypothetical protein MPSEU_000632600 [Mayamaea pseudoterrestris]